MRPITRAGALGALLAPIAASVVACSKQETENGARTTSAQAGGSVSEVRTAAADTGASTAAIDTGAVAALKRMGAYLRTLKAFQVNAATTREEVLADGQKVQTAAVSDVLARVPDRLRVEMTSDRQHRLLFYDGKSFTMWADALNYYATVPAPPTIGKLADQLEAKFDIELPLVDLFYWGSKQSRVGDIKAALDVGPSQVEGTTVEQYAFRQDGLDWQVWIQQGDYPLPRKLVLTTLTDDARPQYSAVLTWNLAPSYNELAFRFDPPAGAQKIVLAETKAPSSGGTP
jgi:hypothetical protein